MRCLAPLYVVEKKYQNIGDRKRKVTDMREDMIQITIVISWAHRYGGTRRLWCIRELCL